MRHVIHDRAYCDARIPETSHRVTTILSGEPLPRDHARMLAGTLDEDGLAHVQFRAAGLGDRHEHAIGQAHDDLFALHGLVGLPGFVHSGGGAGEFTRHARQIAPVTAADETADAVAHAGADDGRDAVVVALSDLDGRDLFDDALADVGFLCGDGCEERERDEGHEQEPDHKRMFHGYSFL
ncbi:MULTISPECIES: hypothetical protein [Luteimonas]|uniref:hypothetical protein n=1 Tax=Luteimonas TaxID=83614 RepID=UPI0011803E91|nr:MULTISPECIES: hypothetical protein [Luteimonas]